MINDFDAERQSLVRNAQRQIADARQEVEALRRLVKLKTHELQHLRRLAQEVLLQRSDVETLLLSALTHVSGGTLPTCGVSS